LTKEQILITLTHVTGVESTSVVGFTSPNQKGIAVIAVNAIGNRLLSDYMQEEINALRSIIGFKLSESKPTTLGNNVSIELWCRKNP
jgi:hypothetical protein